MDNIYQSVKGLCRAIINLLVAVVDLLAGILNGIACLLEKIRPHASGQFRELRENGSRKSGGSTEEENAGKSLKRLSAGGMPDGFESRSGGAGRRHGQHGHLPDPSAL